MPNVSIWLLLQEFAEIADVRPIQSFPTRVALPSNIFRTRK
jgi:hypothetical protein